MKKRVKRTVRAIPGFVSLAEAAKLLGVTPRTVTNMVKAGVIDTVKRTPVSKYACGYSQFDIDRCLAGYREAVKSVWDKQGE
jgi:hypothetical protein